MKKKPEWLYNQSGVIPYRIRAESLEILLITSRKSKKWTIPKGVIERPLSDSESAEKEALEEAGVTSNVNPKEIGIYTYQKWTGTCTVKVFSMKITEVLDNYKEKHQRERAFFTIEEAIEKVERQQLKNIFLKFIDELNKINL